MCQYFGPMLGIQTVLFQLSKLVQLAQLFSLLVLLHKKSHCKKGGSLRAKSS